MAAASRVDFPPNGCVLFDWLPRRRKVRAMPCNEACPGEPTIETDEQAQYRLPPYPIARVTYHAYRREGNPPAEALRLTLELWRELRAEARPTGFGKR